MATFGGRSGTPREGLYNVETHGDEVALDDHKVGRGRLDEAWVLYERLCTRANPLGLLPEPIDPTTGRFLGNYPHGFSHIGANSSGVNLARSHRRREAGHR